MSKTKLKAPFMYPGSKYYVAPRVWELIDSSNVGLLCEPFAGSAALTLTRPNPKVRTKEVINDLNGFIVNFWRATIKDPDRIYRTLDRPLSELDYHACWRYVADIDGKDFSKKLNDNIEFCDVKLAAYWAYAIMASINDHATKLNTSNTPYKGVNNAIPNIGSRSIGLGNADILEDLLLRLRDRLKYVQMMCGDWKRILTPAITCNKLGGDKIAVLLDPPYENSEYLYGAKSGLSQECREWCIKNGSNEEMQIIIFGYSNEHDQLLKHGWNKEKSRAAGNSFMKKEMSDEQMWLSPSIEVKRSPDLLDFI